MKAEPFTGGSEGLALSAAASTVTGMSLTVREHQLLTIAAHPDPKVGRWETTMRERFGSSRH